MDSMPSLLLSERAHFSSARDRTLVSLHASLRVVMRVLGHRDPAWSRARFLFERAVRGRQSKRRIARRVNHVVFDSYGYHHGDAVAETMLLAIQQLSVCVVAACAQRHPWRGIASESNSDDRPATLRCSLRDWPPRPAERKALTAVLQWSGYGD